MAPVRSHEAGAATVDSELWLVDISASGVALDVVETHRHLLARNDVEKFAALSDAAMREARRGAHIALRVAIVHAFGARWRGVPFTTSETGKPSLEGLEGSFSLSHTPGLALIGVSHRGSIGVDIERLRTIRMTEGRRTVIERAGVMLGGGTPLYGDADERLLAAWVRFEAVAKAEGCGVGPLLSRFGLGRREIALETLDIDHQAYDVEVGDGIFAAAALPAGRGMAPLRRLPQTAEAIEALMP
jgi:4'-phosphopantetheinyl transferase